MSTYQIQIDDDAITKQIQDILNTVLNRQIKVACTDTQRAIAEAVKDLIYSRKDEIIEMVVDRASREIVKKGLPRLLERMSG